MSILCFIFSYKMESLFIELGDNQFHYLYSGNQPNAWIVFHGFAQNSESFLPVFEEAKKQYSIISIDLPFHGSTRFNDDYLSIEILEELIDGLVTKHRLKSISLFGFSIGGKLVLSYLQKPRPLLDKVVLAAADGFYMDPYFYISTQNVLGKRLFQYFVKRPNQLITVSKMLYRSGVISKSKWKFADANLRANQQLELVGKVWPAVKDIRIDTNKVIEAILESQTKVLIFVGLFDKIVKPKAAKEFAEALPTVQLVQLACGHNFIKPTILAEVSTAINKFSASA